MTRQAQIKLTASEVSLYAGKLADYAALASLNANTPEQMMEAIAAIERTGVALDYARARLRELAPNSTAAGEEVGRILREIATT